MLHVTVSASLGRVERSEYCAHLPLVHIAVGVKLYEGGIMEGILALAAWVVIAWFCVEIAINRGRSRSRWSFLALFFGPFALVAVLLLPRMKVFSS